ncbi:cobalt-precorrin-5B C(1)-methyltransferase [Clostridia bacterium]|nr:cobalt-precorrin-5B C(1)-methyltransferase [Clostridia bacterium]
MNQTVYKNGVYLRTGYTTGSCATAAAKAAALMLAAGEPVDAVKISTPAGVDLFLEVTDVSLDEHEVSCSVMKDAGDDPDVTNGIKIYATLRKGPEGVRVEGGIGVGRVTKKGLPREIGAAAINPGPLAQITRELDGLIRSRSLDYGFDVLIWSPDGVTVAERTFNPRLGIVGGISILGTTGIVEPMSEAALIETIRLEMRVRRAAGHADILITPGNYGRDFARDRLELDIDSGVKCSNYFGEALDYAAQLKFRRLLLVGHAGKLVKLAAGVMNTHSKIADCRMETLTAHAALAGAGRSQAERLMNCATTESALELLSEWNIRETVFRSVLGKIMDNINHRINGACVVEAVVFTVEAGIVAMTENAEKLAADLRKI